MPIHRRVAHARPELDGPSMEHLLKTQLSVGHTKLVASSIRSHHERCIFIALLLAVAEIDVVIELTLAVRARHAPPKSVAGVPDETHASKTHSRYYALTTSPSCSLASSSPLPSTS